MYQTLNRSINTHHLSSFSQQPRWVITVTKNEEAEAQRGYITSQAARTWEAGGRGEGRGVAGGGRQGGESGERETPRRRPGFQGCPLVEAFHKLLLWVSHHSSMN